MVSSRYARTVRHYLEKAGPVFFTTFAGLAGFAAYFSMYAFRKPFSVALYDAVPGWQIAFDYKTALVLAQVAGYALSKMIGVKYIAEMNPARRCNAILVLIALAWVALLLFAVVPAPWNILTMFLNGMPLGMIWGLVFGFMEGRRTSEVLGAILCASFIVSSGAVKSVGKLLMDTWHVSPLWMPAATGFLFFPLLGVAVWALAQLPPPNAADELLRVRRAPMNGAARARFLKRYGSGIAMLVACYVLTTALRDFRDNFAAEIWNALGFANAAAVYTASELPVAVFALVSLGIVIVIRDNSRALFVIHAIVISGLVLLALSTAAFGAGLLSPIVWMVLSGAGLYAAYVPFNAMLFDRLVAFSGTVANAGFLIYIADACGYVGSCALLLWRNFGWTSLNWLAVYKLAVYGGSMLGIAFMVLSGIFFLRLSAHAVDFRGDAPQVPAP